MAALLDRAGKVNPAINCFADRYFDQAMDQAKEAESRYMKRSGAPRPLDGIPLAVKDAQRLAGRRTTLGSLIFADAVDSHSDPMIERLEAAGAIVFARTTTPEFCLSGVTHSRMWGITRNPWNPEFTPGGSSGGSAAALAAGIATLATGTDIGGSIRIPAAQCGVVGFKPPHGRNPDGPPANFDRFNHCGPLTRTVADAVLMQGITAGPHPHDHDSLPADVRLPLAPASIRGMRIAYSIDFDYVEVDAEVRRNTLAALDVFKRLGAMIEPVALGWSAELLDDCFHWYNTMHYGRQTLWHRTRDADLMTDYALKMADAVAWNSTIDDVHKAWARAHAMYSTLGPVLAAHDVFVCPTNNYVAVKADHDPWDPHFTVNGKKADPEYGWVMTHQFNMLSNCPVLSVPSGSTRQGIPTGIQIVGRTFDDPSVFRAAFAFEDAVGGWYTDKDRRPGPRASPLGEETSDGS